MELINTANNVLRQWRSVSEEWHELDLEYVLAQAWPLDRRYLLDRLLDDMHLMGKFSDELEDEVYRTVKNLKGDLKTAVAIRGAHRMAPE
jgi:hypothetical protein